MGHRPALSAVLCGCLLVLASCSDGADPAAQATATAAAMEDLVVDTTDGASDPMAQASDAASASAGALDPGALSDRRDPERLLRYYTTAIRMGDWQSAARAWTLDAQMTPEKLESQFGGNASPKLAVGKGDTEGAAGSLYYEAPLTVDFADGRVSQRGTIVLRRVNDVPGATEQQLNWRIERSSILPQ